MKTLKEELKVYEFTDFEDEESPIVSKMFHEDDIIKAVRSWLTHKRQEQEQIFDNLTITPDPYDSGKLSGRFNQIDALLEELK